MNNQRPSSLIFQHRRMKKRLTQKSKIPSLKESIKQFCLTTNLHGYRFIVLKNRNIYERLFWITICFLALIISLALISKAYLDFKADPIILVRDSNYFPIYNYDFPAITICPNNKISKVNAGKVARHLVNSSDSLEVDKLTKQLRNMYYLLKFGTQIEYDLNSFIYLQNIFDRNNVSAHDILQSLAPNCDDIIVKCLWKGLARKCSNFFQLIRTYDGYCCSFNYYGSKNIKLNREVRGLTKLPSEPERISSCGYQSGLIVLLDNDLEDLYASYIPSFGFRIKIHNPYSYPDWNSANTFAPSGMLSLIAITPQVTYSTDAVRNVPINIRKCLFQDEKELMYYRHYSFHNCMAEVRLNYTRSICNCTPFTYISKEFDRTLKICNMLDIECLNKIEDNIRSSFPGENVTSENYFDYLTNRVQCYRDCEGFYYTQRTTNSELVKDYVGYLPYLFGEVNIKNHSVLRIFYENIVGIKNRRDVRFTKDAIIAFFGGLLSFLLGFSFVSGTDVVYFLAKKLLEYKKKNKIACLIKNKGKSKLFNDNSNKKFGNKLFATVDHKKLYLPYLE